MALGTLVMLDMGDCHFGELSFDPETFCTYEPPKLYLPLNANKTLVGTFSFFHPPQIP